MKHQLISVLPLLCLAFSVSANTLYRDDGSQIRYYIDNSQAKNLLVVFHGSDCNSVTHMGSVQTIWQEFMPEAALLTIEKYGIDASLPYEAGERTDCPADYLEHNSIAQRIEDGASVVNELKHVYHHVSLAGGSEGGSIALGVASKVDDIHSILVLNAGSSSFQHDIEYSIRQTVPEEEADQVLQGFRQFAEQIKASEEAFEVEVSGHGYAFWKDALSRDLLEPLRQISVPVLIMQSAADESVDPTATQREVESIIASGADNVELMMLPGLDHGFRDEDGNRHLSHSLRGAATWLQRLSAN